MTINIDDWKKAELKVGKILSAEPITGSDKLLKLSVDLGEADPRQILSGIAKYFPEVNGLVGIKCVFITNLEPRMMMGLESQGMLLATSGEKNDSNFFSLLKVSDDVPEGSLVN